MTATPPSLTSAPDLRTATRADIRAAVERVAAELATTAVARDHAGGSALAQRQLLRESGLLTLAIPHAFGGQGLGWSEIYPVIRRITEVDSSLGHLYAFQHLQVASVLLYGDPAQIEKWLTLTVQKNWFWGNAANPRDTGLAFTQQGDGYQLHGLKTFCSGATDAEALFLTAPIASQPGGPLDASAPIVLPADRAGLHVESDWDAIGQRQTDSGPVRFDHVRVAADEVLGGLGAGFTAQPRTPFQTLRAPVAQLILTEIYIGNALGALAAARDYVSARARPWGDSPSAIDDRYIQKHVGELWVALQGAVALADRAALSLEQAWARGPALTADERGATALAVYTAKANATRAALDVTSRVFEVMGAGATLSRFGHDRFWRNVRTHTLHDPVDYKLRDIGRWLLAGQLPVPGLYT